MKVTQCGIPSSSAFSRNLANHYYSDSFEVRLSRPELSMHEIYLGFFAHVPAWLNWLLIVRTRIVSVLGIKGPIKAQLNNVEIKKQYEIGEKIALFTLFSQSDDEIIAGGDDKHLDFRVSVLRKNQGDVNKVVLTTVVNPHNAFGRTIMSGAVTAKRV